MTTNDYLNARELMEKWEMDPIDLYHQIKDGLPAQCPKLLGGWQKLEPHLLNPYDHDFEKHILLLRFWERHVELWEIGGREALDEGMRLRFPKSMDYSPEPQLDGFTSPVKKKSRPEGKSASKKQKRYVEPREKCRKKASSLWEKHPEINRTDMARRREIKLICNKLGYPDIKPRTIEEWIKVLRPGYRGGSPS